MENHVPGESKVFSLLSVGTPPFFRFLVTDQYGQFWTGVKWSYEESDGVLYDSVNAAGAVVQKLLLNQCQHTTVRRYVAPVYLDLYGDDDVSQALIEKWLLKVSRLLVDGESHGNGPVKGAVGLLHIDWSQMKSLQVD